MHLTPFAEVDALENSGVGRRLWLLVSPEAEATAVRVSKILMPHASFLSCFNLVGPDSNHRPIVEYYVVTGADIVEEASCVQQSRR